MNIFELLVLILNGIKNHYVAYHPFFYTSSLWFRILIDLALGVTIFIRLKDLILNFSKKKHSYKKYYLPLLLYSIAISPDVWQVLTISPYFPPMLITFVLMESFLLILILLGRIIFTKKHLEAATSYSEDILDVD